MNNLSDYYWTAPLYEPPFFENREFAIFKRGEKNMWRHLAFENVQKLRAFRDEKLATGQKSPNCLEEGLNPVADKYFNLQGVYSYRLEEVKMVLCQCGCGKEIFIKREHRWKGIARYIRGHNTRGKNHYLYNKHPSEETRKRMSEVHAGKNNSMYGHHHTENTKRKMSKRLKGKPAWNKGLMGIHFSPSTEFKKGQFVGDKSPFWRGGKRIWCAKLNNRRREMGFILLTNKNPYSEPIEYHHIHPELPFVVPCPARIHQMFKGKVHYDYVNSILGISFDFSNLSLLKHWNYEGDI